MYERPQFLTPDGYRRMPKNPQKRAGASTSSRNAHNAVARAKRGIEKRSADAQKGISKEAAKAIAMAIRAMLSQ